MAICADPHLVGALYTEVFGWQLTEDYPGSYRVLTPHAVQIVAIQQRRDLLLDGPQPDFEATVAADDLERAMVTAIAHGGTVLEGPSTIPGAGTVRAPRDANQLRVAASMGIPAPPIADISRSDRATSCGKETQKLDRSPSCRGCLPVHASPTWA